MTSTIHPFCVSITGADDAVRVEDLVALSRAYPFVEWALLYLPEKAGKPRNPTSDWRWEFAAARKAHSLRTALHLCCNETFWTLLMHREGMGFIHELQQYDRLQVNINARANVFTAREIVTVYETLWAYQKSLILQRHNRSANAIDRFLASLPKSWLAMPERVSVLLDASRGLGLVPENWEAPATVDGIPLDTGYAGGISPENIEAVLDATEAAVREHGLPGARYWLDMESGVRTENQFDLAKVERVLEAVARRGPTLVAA